MKLSESSDFSECAERGYEFTVRQKEITFG
jgi:hypothetical protein